MVPDCCCWIFISSKHIWNHLQAAVLDGNKMCYIMESLQGSLRALLVHNPVVSLRRHMAILPKSASHSNSAFPNLVLRNPQMVHIFVPTQSLPDSPHFLFLIRKYEGAKTCGSPKMRIEFGNIAVIDTQGAPPTTFLLFIPYIFPWLPCWDMHIVGYNKNTNCCLSY